MTGVKTHADAASPELSLPAGTRPLRAVNVNRDPESAKSLQTHSTSASIADEIATTEHGSSDHRGQRAQSDEQGVRGPVDWDSRSRSHLVEQ